MLSDQEHAVNYQQDKWKRMPASSGSSERLIAPTLARQEPDDMALAAHISK